MQTNKNIILLLIAGMLFLGMLSFAAAQGNLKESLNDSKKAELRQEAKNATMNYGQCVADAAGAKNECFSATKERLASCRGAVNQTADNKAEARKAIVQCQADSKKEMNACKVSFKNEKKTTCAKIKSTFMEKVRAIKYG